MWRAEWKGTVKKDTRQGQLACAYANREVNQEKNCNIKQLEMQLLPLLCSILIQFKYLTIFLGWGESTGMHVCTSDLMGKLVSSRGTLRTAPKRKGESVMGTRAALLHGWLLALGIQPSPVTQMGQQNTLWMQWIQTLIIYVDSSFHFLNDTKIHR